MTLFFIFNRFQLILAAEAKEKFGIKDEDSILLIRTSHPERWKKALDDDKSHWNKIEIVTPPSKGKVFSVNQAAKKYHAAVDKYSKKYFLNNIILGNYGNPMMRSIGNKYASQGSNIIFLDEGIGTLHLYESRRNHTTGTLKRDFFSKKKVALRYFLSKWFLGADFYDVKQTITFFTQYDLQSNDNTIIVKNDFKRFKREIIDWEVRSAVYFLGSYVMVERGYISKEVYFNAIGEIARYYSGRFIYYIPHPLDPISISTELKDLYSFELLRPDVPFEAFVIQEEFVPGIVAGLLTTAILSCFEFFWKSCEFNVFSFPLEVVQKNQDIVRRIYDQFDFVMKGGSYKRISLFDDCK